VSVAARWTQQRLSTHRLQPQLVVLVLIAVLTPTAAIWADGISWGPRPRVPASPEFIAFSAIGIVSAIAATFEAERHRLAALTLLGVSGLIVCLTFVWFSAPDLALTQLVVEVVTLVLFLLGLRWLPRHGAARASRDVLRSRLRRGRDFVLAASAGAGMAAISYALLTRPAPQSISPFFLERALPEGGGENVVNVMLVDFRAFDTLGEITVLGVVALTVYALLRRFRPARESTSIPGQQQRELTAADLVHPQSKPDTPEGYMLVPAVLVRWLLPIALMIAAYLFLRGHDEPGGGFVAGLVVSIAVIAQYLVAGAQWVEARLEVNPLRWIAIGLLAAVGTGAGAMVAGYPFMTTHTAHFSVPVIGVVHVPSAIAFDVGIFAVVVGSTLLTLIALAHQSLRGRRIAAHASDTVTEPAH